MRGHVVRSFVVVLITGGFPLERIEKSLHVSPRRWSRGFHHRKAATGVLNENGDQPVAHAGLVDLFLDRIRDFIRSFAICSHLDLSMMNAHGIIKIDIYSARD